MAALREVQARAQGGAEELGPQGAGWAVALRTPCAPRVPVPPTVGAVTQRRAVC